MKPVRVLLSPEARETLTRLKQEASRHKTAKSIVGSIQKKIDLIKANPHYGQGIPKDRIPLPFKQKYGITNLFRVELSAYWRLLYTLTDSETKTEIIAFILDFTDHPAYDKLFGYKKK